MGAVDIDEAIDRLIAAYDHAGLDPVRPAPEGVEEVLARVREGVLPFRLPEQVERLWRRVDPGSVQVAPLPRLTGPSFALDVWREHLEIEPQVTPRLLFPVCYESRVFFMVELEDGLGSGGPLLEFDYEGMEIYPRFASAADYVDLVASMIEAGEFAYTHHEGRSWPYFDPHRRWRGIQETRLAAAGPLGLLGETRAFGNQVRDWPAHWLRSCGLRIEDRMAQGATTTIGELLARAGAGERVVGRVHARVVHLAPFGTGVRAAVEDDTGTLDLWCPAQVCVYGPAIRGRFEFVVITRPYPPAGPDWGRQGDDMRYIVAGDLDGARVAAENWQQALASPPAAAAAAIRPLD